MIQDVREEMVGGLFSGVAAVGSFPILSDGSSSFTAGRSPIGADHVVQTKPATDRGKRISRPGRPIVAIKRPSFKLNRRQYGCEAE